MAVVGAESIHKGRGDWEPIGSNRRAWQRGALARLLRLQRFNHQAEKEEKSNEITSVRTSFRTTT